MNTTHPSPTHTTPPRQNNVRRCLLLLLVLLVLAGCASVAPDDPARVRDDAAPPAPPTTTAPHATSTLPPPPTATPRPLVIHDIEAPIDWYVWQGYWRDGELEMGAKFNCGPAAVAMALRYASNNALQLTPEEVRDLIPHKQGKAEGMLPEDLLFALDHWEVPWRSLTRLEEIEQAITRNHVVLVSVRMSKISATDDAPPVWACAGEGVCEVVSGRYYTYEGQHAVIAKGMVQDSRTGQRYVVVYDPNVWGGNEHYYYQGNVQYPKGLNRLYPYEEFEAAFYAQRPKALEILATPWEPIAVPEAASVTSPASQPVQSQPFWCYQLGRDVGELGWCGEG